MHFKVYIDFLRRSVIKTCLYFVKICKNETFLKIIFLILISDSQYKWSIRLLINCPWHILWRLVLWARSWPIFYCNFFKNLNKYDKKKPYAIYSYSAIKELFVYIFNFEKFKIKIDIKKIKFFIQWSKIF